MSGKERVDTALVRRGLAQSREKAQAMIMAGEVYIGERKINKSSETVKPDEELMIRGETDKFVSRGAHKLEKAVRVFNADLNGRVVMDIGASTGGFTDICLRNGAKHVYSIDVGYGQLDWKLREDPRVICMEKTNFRYVKPEDLDPARMPDFASVDVSFISLSKILPPAHAILPAGGEMVCLIKPQFEAGREKVGKKGVVRDPRVHIEVIENVLQIAQGAGFAVLGLSWSPIRGPEGNIEYLMHLRRLADDTTTLPSAAPAPLSANSPADLGRLPTHEEICELVRKSHETL